VNKTIFLLAILAAAIVFAGCTQAPSQQPTATPQPTITATPTVQAAAAYPRMSRESAIPLDELKMTPELDKLPPILHSDEWEAPVPLPAPINTKGAEDSAFMMPDGNTIYVWFTPGTQDLQKQLFDNVTGIYALHKVNGQWSDAERIWLSEPGKLGLDGCEFVQGNEMWFCSAREGYTGIHLFTAEFVNGKWTNWQHVSDQLVAYEVGEMHITADGRQMYYHSPRAGGKGGYDIWMIERNDGGWSEPVNVEIVNSNETEGWPFVTQDGNELWFTRIYLGSPAIFRSKKINATWSEPELIISQFAGESSLDNEGNIYFTHHFYENGTMIEADIYVARKK